MKLEGKRIAILTAHDFEDIEVMYALLRLSEEGTAIDVATLPLDAVGHFSTRPYWPEKPITGRFGATVPFYVLEEGNRWKHISTNDLDAAAYDAVVIPGGFAPDYLRCDDKVLSFVDQMYKQGKVVAAICHGPQVLISADVVKGTGMLKGKTVCSWLAIKDDLINAGGKWVDEPAVREGNLVTGRVPDDLPEFCLSIIEALT